MSAQALATRSLDDEFAAWYRSDPRFAKDPYAFYARLREEAPVYRVGDLVVFSRYADCNDAAIEATLWKTDGKSYDYGSLDTASLPEDARENLRKLFQIESLALNKMEGEQHRRVRGLVQRAFTPRTIDAMAGRMRQVANELVDEVAASGRMEAVHDFAFQLPLIMICSMLEVPIADRHKIREWGLGISGLFSGERNDIVRVIERAYRNRKALYDYLRGVIEERRTRGGDQDSVMSILLSAEAGDRLTTEELVCNTVTFVFAGHETTTNGIANAIIALMTNRDQWEALLADPSLMRSVADESLRYLSPVQTEPRWASRDVEIGGESVRKGERVRMLWGSANRDGERFGEPDRYDLTRKDIKHLAFGAGRHYCLGASLARLEITTAIETLARRFPEMRMADPEPRWKASYNVRSVDALPLVLGPDRA